MARSMAAWKLLEDMALELKKAGVDVPAKTIEDLRSAKSMLKLSCMEGSGDATQKAEELLAGVEAYVVTEGQRLFGEEKVDEWLRKLEEANVEVCAEGAPAEDKFLVGVPRDQKWIRLEPSRELSAEEIEELAGQQKLQVKRQTDGKLVVYGSGDKVKAFVKSTAAKKRAIYTK